MVPELLAGVWLAIPPPSFVIAVIDGSKGSNTELDNIPPHMPGLFSQFSNPFAPVCRGDGGFISDSVDSGGCSCPAEVWSGEMGPSVHSSIPVSGFVVHVDMMGEAKIPEG